MCACVCVHVRVRVIYLGRQVGRCEELIMVQQSAARRPCFSPDNGVSLTGTKAANGSEIYQKRDGLSHLDTHTYIH